MISNSEIKDLFSDYPNKSLVDKEALLAYNFINRLAYKHLPEYSDKEFDYNERVKRNKHNYVNFISYIQTLVTDTVFKNSLINRKDTSPNGYISSSVNGGNISLHRFMRDRVSYHLLLAGACVIVSDKDQPDENLLTKAKNKVLSALDVKKAQLKPYFYVSDIRNVKNYKINKKGELEFIILFDREEKIDDKTYKYYFYFDKSYSQEFRLTDSEEIELTENYSKHELGQCPAQIKFLKEDGQFGFTTGKSLYADIIPLVLQYYEKRVELNEMILKGVFLKLIMDESLFQASQGQFGNSNILVKKDTLDTPDGEKPNNSKGAEYLTVPLNEFKILLDVMEDIKSLIHKFARIRDKSNSNVFVSGESKRYDTSDENSMFASVAESMQDIENWIFEISAKRDGNKESYGSSEYPTTYDVRTFEERLEDLTKLFKSDLGSVEFNKQILKDLIKSYFNNNLTKEVKDILKSVDEMMNPALSWEDLESFVNGQIAKPELLFQRAFGREADSFITKFKAEKK